MMALSETDRLGLSWPEVVPNMSAPPSISVPQAKAEPIFKVRENAREGAAEGVVASHLG
jgi:hypothetical protein